MSDTEFTLPTIHLNGTGAKSLENEYLAVYQATDALFQKLAVATCHPRDFYPQGDGAWEEARRERGHMLSLVESIAGYSAAWVSRAQSLH